MANKQQKLILTLLGILLLVILISSIVLLMLPSGEEETPLFTDNQEQTAPAVELQETASQTTTSSGFNTSIFQGSGFRSLNLQLINSNRLPVQPPAVVGKANPFL